jgi:protease PrsW
MSSFPRAILIISLSLLPCGLWLWYFATRSRYKRPPLRLVTLTFLLGGTATLAAFPVSLFGQALVGALLPNTFWAQALALVLVVGPVEELAKLAAVRAYAYRQPEFDEALDGVVYSATAALGFAAVENVFYLAETSALLVLLRGPVSNPGHALFAAFWGLSLSRAKGAPNIAHRRLWIVTQGWMVASLLHGLFNVLLLASERAGAAFFYALVGAMVALFFVVRGRIHFHRDTSPHREGTLLLPVRRGGRGGDGLRAVRRAAAGGERVALLPRLPHAAARRRGGLREVRRGDEADGGREPGRAPALRRRHERRA